MSLSSGAYYLFIVNLGLTIIRYSPLVNTQLTYATSEISLEINFSIFSEVSSMLSEASLTNILSILNRHALKECSPNCCA